MQELMDKLVRSGASPTILDGYIVSYEEFARECQSVTEAMFNHIEDQFKGSEGAFDRWLDTAPNKDLRTFFTALYPEKTDQILAAFPE